jgi:hypothetical protein
MSNVTNGYPNHGQYDDCERCGIIRCDISKQIHNVVKNGRKINKMKGSYIGCYFLFIFVYKIFVLWQQSKY